MKKILSIFLCFILFFSFNFRFFTYAQNEMEKVQNDIERVQNGTPAPIIPNEMRNLNTSRELTKEKAGEYLRQLGLYTGYEDGSLGLNRNITRAEFATLAVRIEGLEGSAASLMENQSLPPQSFYDMPTDHWAFGYVSVAASNELIKGFEDGSFRPEEEITYAQALAIVIRILGYEDDIVGEWPDNYLDMGKELGLDKNVALNADTPINRGKIALLIFNGLQVVIK